MMELPSEHINELAMYFVFTAFFATSEHINEAAMNFVFTAFFATIFISGMLCVLSCVSCAWAAPRAARRLRALADQHKQAIGVNADDTQVEPLPASAELEPVDLPGHQADGVEVSGGSELRRHGVEESGGSELADLPLLQTQPEVAPPMAEAGWVICCHPNSALVRTCATGNDDADTGVLKIRCLDCDFTFYKGVATGCQHLKLSRHGTNQFGPQLRCSAYNELILENAIKSARYISLGMPGVTRTPPK